MSFSAHGQHSWEYSHSVLSYHRQRLSMIGLSITQWSPILVAIIWAITLSGYKLLDGMAKWIISALAIATVLAVIITGPSIPNTALILSKRKHLGKWQLYHSSFPS